MPSFVVASIDGTGSSNWRRADGSNSHVFKFHRDFGTANDRKRYFDGPDTLGFNVDDISSAVLEWTLSALRRIAPTPQQAPGGYACIVPRSDLKICIVGHSRGGLIAIEVARELSRHGYPVFFMGLYDAVDMAMFHEGDMVTNAEVTYHALRHPALRSRSSWGNTGRDHHARYYERHFMTSHGGIGGDPVLEEDGAFSDYSCDTTTLRAKIMAALGTDLGELCQTQSSEADRWIRRGAVSVGLPIAVR
jgi:hypothetical protein